MRCDLPPVSLIALLDHDDELSPLALYCVALALNRNPDLQLIYSDEDKLDREGRRCDPHFKPDWNPDLFTSQNYISHLTVYRAALVREVGGFREGFEGSQDYDLTLRCLEKIEPAQIHHIPRVLYHWRMTSKAPRPRPWRKTLCPNGRASRHAGTFRSPPPRGLGGSRTIRFISARNIRSRTIRRSSPLLFPPATGASSAPLP